MIFKKRRNWSKNPSILRVGIRTEAINILKNAETGPTIHRFLAWETEIRSQKLEAINSLKNAETGPRIHLILEWESEIRNQNQKESVVSKMQKLVQESVDS